MVWLAGTAPVVEAETESATPSAFLCVQHRDAREAARRAGPSAGRSGSHVRARDVTGDVTRAAIIACVPAARDI